VTVRRAFDAIVDQRTRIVILGSLPGEVSLAQRQYYANPTNQFWRLMGEVLHRELVSLSYEARLAALLAAGIGLWDVIETARRRGSGDSAIRDHQARSLGEFAAALPALRALAFNGQKAAKIGRKQLAADPRWQLVDLPSSSAAHCSISFAQKVVVWRDLRRFLGEKGPTGT